MTRDVLLDRLKELTNEETAGMLLPVSPQKDNPNPDLRAPDVYRMRLIKSSAAQRLAPYILHQLITGEDKQTTGSQMESRASVRSVFCVYSEDEQEGGLMLLNLIERLRLRLLRDIIVGYQFELDLEAGLETFIYPDDTAPYYAGEMTSTWILPAVKRGV
jgi:hypothetical protein